MNEPTELAAMRPIISLYIDADNCNKVSDVPLILQELELHGQVRQRKAFANWQHVSKRAWRLVAQRFSVELVHYFATSSAGKNGADISLAVDLCMNVLMARSEQPDIVAIASSDSDFTSLVLPLVRSGIKVFGFGKSSTPKSFISSCDRFFFLDYKFDKPISTQQEGLAASSLQAIERAISLARDNKGWSPLTEVGKHLRDRTSIYKECKVKSLTRLFNKYPSMYILRQTNDNGILVKLSD